MGREFCKFKTGFTGFSSEMGTKLRDWAIGQAGAAATLGQHCPQLTQRRRRAAFIRLPGTIH